MADRTMYVLDTTPSAEFSIKDLTGILDLTGAVSIVMKFIGKHYSFGSGGVASAIHIVEGSNTWNLAYAFAATDLAQADDYACFAVVTWSTGPPPQIETYPTGDVLHVLALPVTS